MDLCRRRLFQAAGTCAMALAAAKSTMAAPTPSPVDRLYILNAGIAIAPDRSIYTPGRWKGEPVTLPCHAYLLRRAGEWMLWDTGIDDALAAEPGGRVLAHGLRGLSMWRIVDQLAEIGIAPRDVGRVILSHGHFDHIGNARLFTQAQWHMQRAEHDAMFGADFERYGYTPALYDSLRGARLALLDGDSDLFNDGSVRVVSTPGHTPGHASLLVRLPKTGAVILAADVAHYRHNLDGRIVPEMNASKADSRASMDKIVALAAGESAQLWLNHDIAQAATLPGAPAFFD